MAHVLGPTLLCRGLESCGFYKDAEGEYTRIQAAHRDFLSDPPISPTLHFTLLSQSTIFQRWCGQRYLWGWLLQSPSSFSLHFKPIPPVRGATYKRARWGADYRMDNKNEWLDNIKDNIKEVSDCVASWSAEFTTGYTCNRSCLCLIQSAGRLTPPYQL